MITKRKCVFCGNDIDPGTGKMVVDPSGTVSFYCSSKCEKNIGLKRRARKVKWTAEYRKEKAIRVQHLKDSAPKKVEDTPKEVKAEVKAETKAEKPAKPKAAKPKAKAKKS
jgi:large subunit ribosomal protein L24e